jgi:pyrroline-5-carboxylate reductase
MTDQVSLERVAILGTGNMGSAIIRGLLAAKTVAEAHVWASDRDSSKLEELRQTYGISVTTSNTDAVRACKLIVLAVKPQIIGAVLAEIAPHVTAEHVIVSIAAGVTLSTLEGALRGVPHVIRSMPNTPAVALAAVTALAKGTLATPVDLAQARRLFESIGRVVEIEEPLIDAVTGLSGSGPAYVLLAIEALADGGVRMGLPRPTAQLLAAQTVFGTAKMVLESGEHPARLRDAVTSPGGTTIAGLCALEAHAVRSGFIEAVTAATHRSVELGQLSAKKTG